MSRALHLVLVRRGASSRRRCAELFPSLKWSAVLQTSLTLPLASQFAACQESTRKELQRQEGEHRQDAASQRCAARCPSHRCPSRARVWDTHTACSPLLLVLSPQVRSSSLNTPADLLSIISVALSVAVGIETGRVDALFDVTPTLAACKYYTVPVAVAGTLRLRVACA